MGHLVDLRYQTKTCDRQLRVVQYRMTFWGVLSPDLGQTVPVALRTRAKENPFVGLAYLFPPLDPAPTSAKLE